MKLIVKAHRIFTAADATTFATDKDDNDDDTAPKKKVE